MARGWRALRFFIAAAALGSLALSARDATADPPEADAARLSAAGHSLKWNWVPPGKSERCGHAENLIAAPLSAVRAVVTDFPHYKDLVPSKFHNAHVIGKENGSTDLYMQVPVLHGMLTLWDVARFAPLRQVGGAEVLEGNLVKGNIRAMNLMITMRPLGERWTLIKLDMLLLPNIPAPQSAIDEELRDAALQAVDAIHDRAQGNQQWLRWSPDATANAAEPQCGGS